MSGPMETSEVRWHMLSTSEVATALDVGCAGLSSPEVDRQSARFGPNALPRSARRNVFLRFLAQFHNTLIYVLLAGALAAALLDHMIDAVVIVAVVIVNAVIGHIQEGKAEQALEAIQQMIAPKASVVRDGVRQTIPVREIVPGDLVMIEAGDRVPADLRLLHARRMLIDEALLTGESVAAEKQEAVLPEQTDLADRRNMAFSGTMVAAGHASGLAVATGSRTQIGRISSLIQSVEQLATPLLKQIDGFARRFTWFVLAGGLALFAFAVLARNYDWIDALIAVVALAVGIVPEGLPAVITITLAIGVRRMAGRNAVIRKLPAVETLGATSVICTDKTGTLTRNEMTARRVITERHTMIASGSGYVPDGQIRIVGSGDQAEAMADAMPLIRCGLLCNDAALRKVGAEWRVEGDPMEGALFALAMKAAIDPEQERAEWERLDEIPFDAAHRFMATLCRGSNGTRLLFVKGAPEALLAMTAPDNCSYWESSIATAGSDGERVLAFGAKEMPAGSERISFEDLSTGVCLLGLVGFIDPPRAEVKDAIAECRSAGIGVKMITGDHAATALAIARQLDLADDPRVLTGLELEKLPDTELEQAVADVSVFARTSPEHKLRIVRALQAQGKIVAMTGDGVNDAPSLKQADVGVAMGIKGTEASKEAASMVLLDDNFASIVSAVREGRTVYDNIRKVISWEIPTNGRIGDPAGLRAADDGDADPLGEPRPRRHARPRAGVRAHGTRCDVAPATGARRAVAFAVPALACPSRLCAVRGRHSRNLFPCSGARPEPGDGAHHGRQHVHHRGDLLPLQRPLSPHDVPDMARRDRYSRRVDRDRRSRHRPGALHLCAVHERDFPLAAAGLRGLGVAGGVRHASHAVAGGGEACDAATGLV